MTDKTWVTVRRQDLADALREPKFGTPEMTRLTDAILYGTDNTGRILPRHAGEASDELGDHSGEPAKAVISEVWTARRVEPYEGDLNLGIFTSREGAEGACEQYAYREDFNWTRTSDDSRADPDMYYTYFADREEVKP